MEEVACWHCEHYIWFSLDAENRFAFCKIKNKQVFGMDRVCEKFFLNKSVYTNKKIPEYCINYKKK